MKKLKNKWITKEQTERLYEIPVPILGLTGGIATGKSTVAQLFRQNGFAVIDADQLVKNVYSTPEALQFVTENFSKAISAGKIDFKILRQLVFSSSEGQQIVETFIYSKLPGEFVRTFNSLPPVEFVIYDVPLLFEKKLDQKIDSSICVYCPRVMQLDRLMKRDHIEKDLAESILNKQMDIEEKRNLSDLIIENVAGVEELERKFQQLLVELI